MPKYYNRKSCIVRYFANQMNERSYSIVYLQKTITYLPQIAYSVCSDVEKKEKKHAMI